MPSTKYVHTWEGSHLSHISWVPWRVVVVLRVGDAWLVGVGKRAPHGVRCPCLVSPHGSLDRLKSLVALFP